MDMQEHHLAQRTALVRQGTKEVGLPQNICAVQDLAELSSFTEPWGPAGVRLVGERCTPWAPPP